MGMGGMMNNANNQALAKARHASAKKRPPAAQGGIGQLPHQVGRSTQGAWATGQLPVAMQ